jgi:hypothetical protein
MNICGLLQQRVSEKLSFNRGGVLSHVYPGSLERSITEQNFLDEKNENVKIQWPSIMALED